MDDQRTNRESGPSLRLFFANQSIGQINHVVFSDYTGFGVFRPDPKLPGPIQDFIAFSESWHARLKRGDHCDASEFEMYDDICNSSDWNTVDHAGSVVTIGAPSFIDGEITWRTKQQNL